MRNLREPLIPTSSWKDFSNAAQNANDTEAMKDLYRAVNNLPLANRDTLAFLMQHFLRVANATEVKMPASNIAKVFGPTIIGYSSPEPDQFSIFSETIIQATVRITIFLLNYIRFINFGVLGNGEITEYSERILGPISTDRVIPIH